MRATRGRSGFTVLELMIAIGIAAMLLTVAADMIFRGTRISDNAADSTRINTMTTAFRERVVTDLRHAQRTQSHPHTDGSACAYIATPNEWISYCNTPQGVYRAQVPRGPGTPPQVSSDQPLFPHGAERMGSAYSTRVATAGSTVTVLASGAAFNVELLVPHPDPTLPPARVDLSVTPRIGG